MRQTCIERHSVLYNIVQGGEHVRLEEIPLRLSKLRTTKSVSARDMSLSLGQNVNYINGIENGRAYPSMEGLFNICEYLNITPKEFFDDEVQQPERLRDLIADLRRLDAEQLAVVSAVVAGLLKK